MENTRANKRNYCPIRYGQAVYTARVLISTQYGYEASYWNDEELCTSRIEYRKGNPTAQSLDNTNYSNDFTIFPNPASTELNFNVKSTNKCQEASNTIIEIIDILGNSVTKKEYVGFMQVGKINISILANGAYLIKYSCGNNEIYRQTFVVNK